MGSDENKSCQICGAPLEPSGVESPFVQAGEWLAETVWKDCGALCHGCLENRGRLAMMYLHDRNR